MGEILTTFYLQMQIVTSYYPSIHFHQKYHCKTQSPFYPHCHIPNIPTFVLPCYVHQSCCRKISFSHKILQACRWHCTSCCWNIWKTLEINIMEMEIHWQLYILWWIGRVGVVCCNVSSTNFDHLFTPPLRTGVVCRKDK